MDWLTILKQVWDFVSDMENLKQVNTIMEFVVLAMKILEKAPGKKPKARSKKK